MLEDRNGVLYWNNVEARWVVEGRLLVTRDGHAWSFSGNKNGREVGNVNIPGGGYVFVNVPSSNGKRSCVVKRCRLILTAFTGESPIPGDTVDHFPDKSVTNDALNNLRWRDYSANSADHLNPRRKKCITFQTACIALWMFERGASLAEVATFTGLTNKGAQNIKYGRSWKYAVPVQPRKPVASTTRARLANEKQPA